MSSTPAEILAQMIATAGFDSANKVHVIEIPPGSDPGTFMAEFAEKFEAEHRKGCADCAAAYEADQMVEKAKAAAAHEAAEKAKAAEAHGCAADEPKRTLIGHMVFMTMQDKTRPIPSSFHLDRDELTAKLNKFMTSNEVAVMASTAALIGMPTPVYTIRPIYAD